MGLRQTRQKDLLDGSEWLRTVVQHYQKKRNGVSGYECFLTEPAEVVRKPDKGDALRHDNGDGGGGETATSGGGGRGGDCCDGGGGVQVRYTFQAEGVRLTRVNIRFRNSKEQMQEVHWVVKSASAHREGRAAIQAILHEAKVFSSLLPDTQKFLASKKNGRARYLLNIPDLVFQERRCESGHVTRCHLVIEDVTKTKHCSLIEMPQMEGGLSIAQFRVFLGTLAQFHAVGLAWNIATKDDSIMDSFPFLNSPDPDLSSIAERERLLIMYDKLLRWQQRLHPKNKDCQQRTKLFNMMHSTSNNIWRTSLQSDMCDSLGGLCLGPILPCELMFQYERPAAAVTSLFEFCTNPTYMNDFDLLSEEEKRRMQELKECPPAPVCAAVTSCHRVHFGLICRDVRSHT
jgi:hypothetical protein